jgi:hypothetical protein
MIQGKGFHMPPFRSLANVLLAVWQGILAAPGWLVSLPFAGFEWLRQFRVELWSVEGEERSSRLPLTVLCSGSEKNRNYVLKLTQTFGDYADLCRLPFCGLR